MGTHSTIFVVDDDIESRELIELMLGQFYEVETFSSAQACLDRLPAQIPDFFVLDVSMPGIDGFSLCRILRENPATRHVPVIFASGLLDLDSHLAGYDAGGDDFVIKPLNFPELKQKMDVLLRLREQASSLRQQIDDSELLTSLILSNLDEYAVLVKFLRALNGCEQYGDISTAMFEMLDAFHLDGVLQFRVDTYNLTINKQGEMRPIEASIINQIRDMGSVVTYKARSAYNFGYVSLMVYNMPQSDPELCGRLRDHFAIAVETANSRVTAIAERQENNRTKSEIALMLSEVGSAAQLLKQRYSEAHAEGSQRMTDMLHALDGEFTALGMSEFQEESIKDSVRSMAERLVELFDLSDPTEQILNKLLNGLGEVL